MKVRGEEKNLKLTIGNGKKKSCKNVTLIIRFSAHIYSGYEMKKKMDTYLLIIYTVHAR